MKPESPAPFRHRVEEALDDLVLRQQAALGGASQELLRVDLHCHDRNSDVPDETLGRILRVPETWLPTERLTRVLRQNGADLVTVTNHNNARSCFELQDKGVDVLVGAEFSCTLPDFKVGVHVLTFGFTPEQETRLLRLRRDLYRFLEYARDRDIPTVLAHPLHFYSPSGTPPLALLEKLSVCFERFEAVNGQRDAWQNLLTAEWVESLDPERIESFARKAGIPAGATVRDPYRKRMSGGSDCHFGLFAGSTGTLLRVDAGGDEAPSQKALAALRAGRMAPYGAFHGEEKLGVAFLDYFCQLALQIEDPGLMRLLLHRGTANQKLMAFGILNGLLELRRNPTAVRFLKTFHLALQGRKPDLITRWLSSSAYRPLVGHLSAVASARRRGSEALVDELRTVLPDMLRHLEALLASRIEEKARALAKSPGFQAASPRDWIRRLEVPAELRALGRGSPSSSRGDLSVPSLEKLSDGLPFPLLMASILGGAAFASARVLNAERRYHDLVARGLGKHEHPRRALWLTDTLEDRNGVSHALQQLLSAARERDLPLDILTCAGQSGRQDHLHLLRPVSEFTLPFYAQQPFRVPDLLDVHRVFSEGAYDRVVCSTEAPMGLYALYLKHAFHVPAYFFLHTDWLDFARRSLRFDRQSLDRLRRWLRAFYRRFDGIFVLNTEQRDWLVGPEMEIPAERVFLTAHWVDAGFGGPEPIFAARGRGEGLRVLYAGRLSEEKGVFDLPPMWEALRRECPEARLLLAGTGPAEAKLRQALPDAEFLGWVDRDRLAALYSGCDALVLPSRFDTFGCVVIEAMSRSLPVVAYAVKGPRDLVEEGRSGFLADSPAEMAEKVARLRDPALREKLRRGAWERAQAYGPEPILRKLTGDLGLEFPEPAAAIPFMESPAAALAP